MKKKIVAVIALTAIIVCGHSYVKSETPKNDIVSENVEALTSGENDYSRVANRERNQCRIYIGAKGAIKLFNGTIIRADGSGYVSFDGEVVCSGSGDIMCKPVECVELYQTVM